MISIIAFIMLAAFFSAWLASKHNKKQGDNDDYFNL